MLISIFYLEKKAKKFEYSEKILIYIKKKFLGQFKAFDHDFLKFWA